MAGAEEMSLVPPQFVDAIIKSPYLEGERFFVKLGDPKIFRSRGLSIRSEGMYQVKVRKSKLLEKIKVNREKHIKEYKEACAGYKEAALAKVTEVFEELREKIADLKEGRVIELAMIQFSLDVPRSFEDHYDRAIGMLEMSVEDELQITADEYSQYVMDKWQWKQEFTTTTSNYIGDNLRKLTRRK